MLKITSSWLLTLGVRDNITRRREIVANTSMPTAPLASSTDPKSSHKAGKVNTVKSKKSQSTLKDFLSTSVGSQNSLNSLHSINASQAAQVHPQPQLQMAKGRASFPDIRGPSNDFEVIAQNDSDDDVDLEQTVHCTGMVWAGDVEIKGEWEQPCRQESWADKVAVNAWQLLRTAGLPGQDVDVDVNKDKSSQTSLSQ